LPLAGWSVPIRWLSGLGHEVHLIDPIPLHVEQARVAGLSAEVGDARDLEQTSHSVDAALLLGPLYHLVERSDRLRALAEARRALRPGGLLFAAAISRFAPLLDLLVRLDRLHEDSVFKVVTEALATGRFRGADEAGLFTTAYFHLPSELRREAEDSGFSDVTVLNIEGPGFMIPDLSEKWADAKRREAILEAARLIENEPEMAGAASHLLLVGHV
jgi:SAM-dependent methyltransferase